MNHITDFYQTMGSITQEQRKRYEDIYHFKAIYEGVLSLVQKKDKSALTALFGQKLELLPLLTQCVYSAPFGTHTLRG